MKAEKKTERQHQILDVAYQVLEEKGFNGISMLEIAQRSNASKQTLYRWFDGKLGLYTMLVRRNADLIAEALEKACRDGETARERFEYLGHALLKVLTGERAIVLNRAAAADETGQLGKALAGAGRNVIFPRIVSMFMAHGHSLSARYRAEELAELYVGLLVGDLQIRRAIRVVPVLDDATIKARVARANDLIFYLADRSPDEVDG